MPINHHPLGEVPQTPLPQGTEAKAAMNQNLILDNRHNHQPTSPLSILRQAQDKFGEGTGVRSICKSMNHSSEPSFTCQSPKKVHNKNLKPHDFGFF